MTNLDSILKSRNITLLTKVHIVKAMVFPVVRYGCESWTRKKAEHWRTDAFELWCWRRLLRVPWTGRRSNPSILKEISSEYSLEGLMLKLKLQYFGHLPDAWNRLIRKDLDAGKDWRQEKGMTADEMIVWHHQLMDMSLSKLQELVKDREAWHVQSMGSQRVEHDWATELNWTHTGRLVKQEKQILISWRAGVLKSKIKSLANLVSGEGSLWFHSLLCLAVSSHGEKGKGALWGLYQSVNPMREDFTHMTCSPPSPTL